MVSTFQPITEGSVPRLSHITRRSLVLTKRIAAYGDKNDIYNAKANLSVRSCACAASTSLDAVKIIEKHRHKIMMHKFAAILVVDDHGKDRKSTGHVISQYCEVWVVV